MSEQTDTLTPMRGHPDRANPREGFVPLIVFLLAAVLLAWITHGLAVLVVVLALVAMVMLHEFGHFVTAKLSGMKVTEYFLGFGPKLWSIRRGETEFGVKALPAGGYVRIVGMTSAEDVDPADEPRSYREASFPRRILVSSAGSAMHFVIAFVLLWTMVSFTGVPVGTSPEVSALTTFKGLTSPAQTAGIRPGDVIESIDGHHYNSGESYVTEIRSHPGSVLTVVVKRSGKLLTLHVRPFDAANLRLPNGKLAEPGARHVGMIGVEISFISRYGTTNPLVGVQRAGSLLASVTKATALGIGQVFSFHGLGNLVHQVATAQQKTPAATSSSSSSQNGELLSIVGAIQIGAQAAGQNVSELLYILVAINIFIGMVNLFPMLPLDGGHVAIAVYERVRSRRNRVYHADVTKLMPVAYIFLASILLLGLSTIYLNIVHPVSLPGG